MLLSAFGQFNQRGGGGGVLSAFGWFNQWQRGGRGGGAVRFLADSTSGVGVLSVCFRLIQPAREGRGGGGVLSVCFWPI